MKKIFVLLIFMFNLCSICFAQVDALERSAESGDENAQMFLAKAFYEGNGSYRIQKNVYKAQKYFKLASDHHNNSEAQYYLYQISCQLDDCDVSLLKKSADNGYGPAQCNLAFLYGKGYDNDNGLLEYKYYKLSADQGFVRAFDGLGDCYRFGRGVPQNVAEAKRCYQIAVDNGLTVAYIGLSMSFALMRDTEKALVFAQKAADADYIDGYHLLALFLKEKKEYQKAHNAMKTDINKMRDGQGYRKFAPLPSLMATDGEIYLAENDIEMATHVWQRIVDLDSDFAYHSNEPFCNQMQSLLSNSIDANIPQGTFDSSKTFVVVISNENYKREENVPYANNDGKTFAQYCNKTLNIPEKNIQVIEDASLNDIKYSVNWLSKTVNSFNGEAKAIFYYAGHGIPDESDRSAYLLPTDGFGNDTETAYSLNTLFNTFGNLNTKCGLIILDACFSGTKRDGEIMEMSRGVAIKVKDNAPQGNTIVISASQGDETAYPFDDQKHGLFTYYLLSHLKDKKGDVSIEDLFNSTKQNVSQQSLVQNKKSQTPSISVSPNMRNIWHKIKIAE